MVSMERQRLIEANRSLRLIKNELESLLDKGIITEDVFDSISRQLPTEQSLSHGAPRSPSPVAPAAAMSNLRVSSPTPSPAPPSYNASTGPPPLPGRNPPPPLPPPAKPVLCRARALYRYVPADARDVGFERDDAVDVHEYMNADWWMGRNLRTGQEGIFPKNYVEVVVDHSNNNGYGGDEKAAQYQAPGQPQYSSGGYHPPPPPPQANPYNASVPPMAVAGEQQQQGGGGGKVGEAGKKIGKKLGNAAIFGAGATIGSNIVNSIF